MKPTNRRTWLAATASLLVLSAAATASAGFIPGSINLGFTPPGPPPWVGSHAPPPFVFNITPGNSSLATMQISEDDFKGLDPLSLRISGMTNSDPIIEIIKSVTNTSGSTWLGYKIGLSPNTNSFVSGSASSDKFTLLSATPNLLTFGLPSPVPTGQTVTFDFKVNIPDTGPFQFDLSQSPVVPEPASAVLAVLGVGLLCCNCRRKAAKRRVDS
jgi:PEP-CTERM motif-containing protein